MNEGLALSDQGLAMIARFEGLRTGIYLDAAGYETIGYGHLLTSADQASRRFIAGITQGQALDLLRADAAIAERAVRELVTVPLSQDRFDALVSFSFNLGRAALAKSTLLRHLNAGKLDGADATPDFVAWNEVRNPITHALEPSSGLTTRRRREALVFNVGWGGP